MSAPALAGIRRALDGVPRRTGGRRPDRPAVAVVVPVLNAAEALPATLDSLEGQRGADFELIVADGGSTDGTAALLEARAAGLSLWISAPDRGIADGFNRGIALARAPVVQITNAGDRLPPGYLARVADLFARHRGAGFVYGDVAMTDAQGRETRRIRGRPDLGRGAGFDSMAVAPHPAMAVRRAAYRAVGLYDPAWPLTMDFDWLARALAAGVRGVHDPGLVALMAEGGASNRGAMRRDLDNFRLALRYRTMNPALATARLGLKGAMNLVRAGLEAGGRGEASYAFRRGVDAALLRRR